MANLSIREAVKHFDVSRPTLTKALKSGKISGNQDENGQWSIDPSEIARLYTPRSGEGKTTSGALSVKNRANFTPLDTEDSEDIAALREQLARAELRVATAETRAEAAEILARERAERIEDLRRMLPPPEQHKRRRWWPWR